MNTESQKPEFFGTKIDLKNTENSNALAPQGGIGQFSPQITQMITQKPLLLLKPQRKLFYFPIRNMLQNNFSHAIFFREGVMSRNRIFHRLRTPMLDTL